MSLRYILAAVCCVLMGSVASAQEPDDQPRLVTQIGHPGGIISVSFSADGRFILTTGRSRIVQLWDASTGRQLRRFGGRSTNPRSAVFSPDGRLILTASFDSTAQLWDASNGQKIGRFKGHSGNVTAVAFSPRGRFVLTASADKTARLWDASTGREIRRFEGHARGVQAVAFSPDGRRVLTGSLDGGLWLWDASNGRRVHRFEGHSRSVSAVAFSPDGQLVLSGSSVEPAARLWDTSTGREIRPFEARSRGVSSVAFSPNGRFILTGGGGEKGFQLWDVSNGRKIRRLEGDFRLKGIISATFSPDGRSVLAGSSGDPAARLWDVSSGREIRRFGGHAAVVNTLAFSPDGSLLLTGGDQSGAAPLWDFSRGREIRRFIGHKATVHAVAFSPDGRFVLTGGGSGMGTRESTTDPTARLWDTSSGQESRRFKGHTLEIQAVAFSPDGRLVLTGSRDHTARLWNLSSGREIRRFKRHAQGVSAVAFSPDGRLVLTGSEDKTARLWKISSGDAIRSFAGHSRGVTSVAFSPEGRLALTGSWDGTARLWEVATGRQLRRFGREDKRGSRSVLAVAFSPDGRFVLTGGRDLTARLWDASSGQELHRFEGHWSYIETVAFSPDGRFVLTGSWDQTTRIWNAVTGAELCRLISFRDGSWIVVDPEGRFDTNNLEEIQGLHWIMPDDPFKPLPVEIFMREYYEPRLLPRILAGERFKPVRSLTELNRVQPEVKITKIELLPDSTDVVSVSVRVSGATGEFQRNHKRVVLETGVYGLRVFRDGQLVGYAPDIAEKQAGPDIGGDEELALWRRTREIRADPKTRQRTIKFENIRLPRRAGLKQVTFSAYGFNVDKVKSATARKTYRIPGSLTPRKGSVYLITVGVNAYQNAAWDLTFAANDARRIAQVLSARLRQDKEPPEKRPYQEIVPILLLSDYRIEEGRRVVTAKSATKANLRAVLDRLAGKAVESTLLQRIPNAAKIEPARPEDLVLISFSSHGFADARGIFYFFPYDIGKSSGQTITPSLLQRAISSAELSVWLRDVDAGELVMIVDACHAAATVQAQGFKPGPMGSRGLGQLSYDKGMRILTASQADNVALESALIRQGLLTYALTHDGLEAAQADFKPKDQTILLAEWLQYAEQRVPVLYGEIKSGQLQNFGDSAHTKGVMIVQPEDGSLVPQGQSSLQRPALFDFARMRPTVVLDTLEKANPPR